MTPPQLHMHLEVFVKAGMLPIWTVGEPGAHGAAMTGTQGAGVNTPSLAAVAAATAGLDIVWHMPKGNMFTMGLLSMILAIGMVVVTRLTGKTISVLGATPKLHCSVAPPHTTCPILITCRFLRHRILAFDLHSTIYFAKIQHKCRQIYAKNHKYIVNLLIRNPISSMEEKRNFIKIKKEAGTSMGRWKRWCRTLALAGLAACITAGSAYAETADDTVLEAGPEHEADASAPDLDAENGEPAGDIGDSAGESSGEASGEADDTSAGDETGTQTASLADALGQWMAYLIASEKAGAWQAYESFVAKLYRDTAVLSRFGLEAPETAQRYGDEWVQAQVELNRWLELQAAAAASLPQRLSAGASLAAVKADMAALPERDPAPLNLLRQAAMNVNAAQRGLRSAQIQHRSGLVTSDDLLAAHKSYLEARIAAADAKEAYYAALRDALAAAGTSASLAHFLKFLEEDDAHLLQEWQELLQLELAETAPEESGPASLEFRAPNGEAAEALPHASVTVQGAEVRELMPPIRAPSGDVYVPLRPYAEALQLEVTWLADAGKAQLTGGGMTVTLTPGASQLEKNGEAAELSAAPYIQHNYLFVPLLFFETVLDKEVRWNDETAQGIIVP